jgi:hypothetical protein
MSKEIEKIIKRVQSDADKKNQKELQKLKAEIKKEFGNQTGVLVEEFQHRVSAIGEQYGSIQKTLNEHTVMLGELTKDKTLLKVQVSDHEHRISALETSLA